VLDEEGNAAVDGDGVAITEPPPNAPPLGVQPIPGPVESFQELELRIREVQAVRTR
jgi:hypothetical protein